MAVTNFTPLLGLALPTTGDLSGTWGTTVNTAITDLLDDAVAGTVTLSADADATLTTTNGADNQARNAVILWTASNGATTRNITAPAQSKAYIVINAGTGSIVIRGSGPTTGVTVVSGYKVLVAWNGSDFVKVASSVVNLASEVTGTLPIANGGTGTTSTTFTNLTTNVTGTLPIANGGTGTTSTTFTNLTTNVTGTLPIANGGTGTTSTTFVNLATNVTGNLPVTNLNAGTSASATTFWRGDGAWGIPSGTGGAGTVTSVAATVPSVFSISGSPITTSGTLAMTYSGTALPVVNGGTGQTTYTDGQLLIGNTTGNTLTKTTLTAGSGITITNASGAITVAATGSGITWTTKTTAYTAVNGDYMFCDTSSAAFTITLPASPTINNTVYFQDAKGTFNVNALSIDPGANTIMGSSGNLVSTLLNAGFGLFFNGTEWRIF